MQLLPYVLAALHLGLTEAAGVATYTSYTTVTSTATVTSSGYPQVATSYVTTTEYYTSTTARTVATRAFTTDASTTTLTQPRPYTTIVPVSHGFTPVLLAPGYTDRLVTTYITSTSTVTATVGGPATTTVTSTSTVSSATATTYSAVTATTYITPVVATTVTTTARPTVTEYAACEMRENYASKLPNGMAINFDQEANNVYGTYTYDQLTAKECCERCQQMPSCLGSQYWDNYYPNTDRQFCSFTTNEDVSADNTTSCRAGEAFFWFYDQEAYTGITWTVSNGPCGGLAPLLANHPPDGTY